MFVVSKIGNMKQAKNVPFSVLLLIFLILVKIGLNVAVGQYSDKCAFHLTH